MVAKPISIDLTEDEAMVLFEWLSRINKSNDLDFEDQAEQRVLWDLEALLEAALAQPFRTNYDQLLADARERVRDSL